MSGKNDVFGMVLLFTYTSRIFLLLGIFNTDTLQFDTLPIAFILLCDCPACTLRPSHRHLLAQAATPPSHEGTGSDLHISGRHDANHRPPHVTGA
jgi:hypothetical protein